MGHVRNYAIGDALARYMDERLQRSSSHGMGFFGLPAENAAIKNNTPPREWTLGNINMKAQMKRLGYDYRAKSPPACPTTTGGTSGSS
jgi:leucyl-tRNA synthetase